MVGTFNCFKSNAYSPILMGWIVELCPKPTGPVNVTLYGNRVFIMTKLRSGRSLRWALIQYDWCPLLKKK